MKSTYLQCSRGGGNPQDKRIYKVGEKPHTATLKTERKNSETLCVWGGRHSVLFQPSNNIKR